MNTIPAFDPTKLIVDPSSSEPVQQSEVLGQLFEADEAGRTKGLSALREGLDLLESASRQSVWVNEQHYPQLDAHQLFQLTNVRRSFLKILDAFGEGNKLTNEQRSAVGKKLAAHGRADYQQLWGADSRELMSKLYDVDASSDPNAAALNDALLILNSAGAQLHISPKVLLERPPVQARFLEILQEIKQQPWFGKDLEPGTRSVSDYADGKEPQESEFEVARQWRFSKGDELLKAAFTVDRKTEFGGAAGKSFHTKGGHTAHAWEFGVMDGEVIIKGTVKDAGMFNWDLDGKDLGGNGAYDLDASRPIAS